MSKTVKFEDKMDELKNIVSKLDDSKTSLDDAIKLYEKGLEISKDLQSQLKTFESKINSISKGK